MRLHLSMCKYFIIMPHWNFISLTFSNGTSKAKTKTKSICCLLWHYKWVPAANGAGKQCEREGEQFKVSWSELGRYYRKGEWEGREKESWESGACLNSRCSLYASVGKYLHSEYQANTMIRVYSCHTRWQYLIALSLSLNQLILGCSAQNAAVAN